MEVNHCAENYPTIISQAYGGGACTKVEIEEEVNPSEYAANEPLYTSSPSSTISGIEGGGAYLETSGKSPTSPGKDHTAVNG